MIFSDYYILIKARSRPIEHKRRIHRPLDSRLNHDKANQKLKKQIAKVTNTTLTILKEDRPFVYQLKHFHMLPDVNGQYNISTMQMMIIKRY